MFDFPRLFPFQLTYYLMKGYGSFYALKNQFLVSLTVYFGTPDDNLCIYCVPILQGQETKNTQTPLFLLPLNI